MISAKPGNTAAVHEMRLKMQPFDAMPDKNKANLGLATVFLLIQRCARVLYVGINARTRLVLTKNMGARLACNQNAAIFDDF